MHISENNRQHIFSNRNFIIRINHIELKFDYIQKLLHHTIAEPRPLPPTVKEMILDTLYGFKTQKAIEKSIQCFHNQSYIENMNYYKLDRKYSFSR